ncbi:GNAT superfamily N-acetyltransferase [Marmoricola sp. URHA0025 HA25]
MDLPLGWRTDLAVRRAGGSTVDELADHLVVRSPDNPAFHWGNFVLVTDPGAVDDADRWVSTFEKEFPGAEHRAIGLVAEPGDDSGWYQQGLVVEHEDVLGADRRPEPTPVPQGYLVRRLGTHEDWSQSTGLELDEYPGDAEFHHAATATRARMSERGVAAWFGAFHGDRLVAQLGIVDCGDAVARYQAVLTAADHRRHGLASHLLGEAAGWAADRRARSWVIVADADSPASRLYQGRGFGLAGRSSQAYRRPASR